jgi:hypothetical protein
MHWIRDEGDDPNDQCAHGAVEFEVNGVRFVSPEDGDITVSAAGLFLLRTLEQSHTVDSSVAPHSRLFPEDGFSAWAVGTTYKIIVFGGTSGVDLEVVRHGETVEFRAPDGRKAVVSASEWREAVVAFVTTVEEFYDSSAPKGPPADPLDREGWEGFWSEWHERKAAAVKPAV